MILLAELCLAFSWEVNAQQGRNAYYAFDVEGKPTSLEDAKFMGIRSQTADTTFIWRIYRLNGAMVNYETYLDSSLNIPNGRFAFYDANGLVDSSGMVIKGAKDGSWFYYTDSLTVYREEKFENGKRLAMFNEKALKQRKDSLANIKSDSGRAADYGKGGQDLNNFIIRNFRYPEGAKAAEITGTVRVYFMIDEEGYVRDVFPYKSVQYTLDDEAMRLVKKTTRWNPATHNGKKVKAYRIQPITFRLE